MSFTSLALGGNWGSDEWPERIAVMHEGERVAKDYVPERTCRVIMKWDGLDGRDPVCSKCGTYFDDKKWHEQKFCPNCGARVIRE